MAEILQLRAWLQGKQALRERTEEAPQKGASAQILLFTGVRYEYLGKHETHASSSKDASGRG